MLLQFSVSNFKSIKDEVFFTAFANNRNEHKDNLIIANKDKILPTLAFYGANAAGKSNILHALSAAINFVRYSNIYQINTKLPFLPFAFDEKFKNGKTKMDFMFIHNEKKYAYGFVADINKVYEEYLYEYKTSKPSMIFERKDVNKYSFPKVHNSLNEYVDKNTDNKLFLSTATTWNSEATKNAYLWFAEGIDVCENIAFGNSFQNYQGFLMYLDKYNDNPEIKNFMKSLLKEADVNISDYEFNSEVVATNAQVLNQNGQLENIGKIKRFYVNTIHKIKNNKTNKLENHLLDFKFESNGTKLLFFYGPLIMDALTKGRTIIIDEIHNSLHTSLAQYLINMFNNKNINQNGAQLIFTTHDTNLLDLDIFRRDQIYFVEKDTETGASDVYSLADFSPRKSENIRKGYLQGRYGAMPFVGDGIKW